MRTAYGLSKYIASASCSPTTAVWNFLRDLAALQHHHAVRETGRRGFSHVFSDMTEKILTRKLCPVPVLGDGGQIRCFTNIIDVAMPSPSSVSAGSENQAVNIGNPNQ